MTACVERGGVGGRYARMTRANTTVISAEGHGGNTRPEGWPAPEGWGGLGVGDGGTTCIGGFGGLRVGDSGAQI